MPFKAIVKPCFSQITCYSHKDDNNKWLVKKAYEDYSECRDNQLLVYSPQSIIAMNILLFNHEVTLIFCGKKYLMNFSLVEIQERCLSVSDTIACVTD